MPKEGITHSFNMALGIETNNVAPQLIQNSGAALVQGIRQIGQQISGHLTEMQVKRDLGAMAQEMQGMNVQSNEFPVQLTQMLSRHPMAARDERGQQALSILGKAHGQWQAGEAEARAFGRAMLMQESRDRSARELYDYKREKELSDPQNVGGALVVPRDPATGQPNVLLPAPARAGAGPKTLAPGAILVDPTGKKLAENPKAITGSPSELSKERLKISLLSKSASSLKSEIDRGLSRLDATEEDQNKALEEVTTIKDKAMKAAAQSRFDELNRKKHAIIKEVNDLKLRHLTIQETLGNIQAGMMGGDGTPEVLPAADAVAAPAAAPNELVLVIDPNGVPGKVKASQLEAALQNGYKRR